MATATKKKSTKKTAAKKTKKGSSTPPKKGRVKLSPERAREVEAMLRKIREYGEEAKNGNKGSQRKIVF